MFLCSCCSCKCHELSRLYKQHSTCSFFRDRLYHHIIIMIIIMFVNKRTNKQHPPPQPPSALSHFLSLSYSLACSLTLPRLYISLAHTYMLSHTTSKTKQLQIYNWWIRERAHSSPSSHSAALVRQRTAYTHSATHIRIQTQFSSAQSFNLKYTNENDLLYSNIPTFPYTLSCFI